jgi:pSer/pThr/pTyr-binding forkhead associated (FHA) protein
MPKLTIRSETGESASYDLVEETNTIGRSPENSIQLDDVSVSGQHAELAVIGENVFLTDLGSTNGTLVNGKPATDVQLRAGDRIRFGKIEARFECDVTGGAQPLPFSAEVEAHPAELSARPANFANASPFPSRKKTKDPARSAILAGVALAFLAFLASMIVLFLMRPPSL